jgi:hypothetical protein
LFSGIYLYLLYPPAADLVKRKLVLEIGKEPIIGIPNMHLEYLTLSSSSAAIDIWTAPNGNHIIVRMLAKVLNLQKVYSDGGFDVGGSTIRVWVSCQGDGVIVVPEDAVGAISDVSNVFHASVAITPSQFELLKSAVLLGSHFEIQLTVDVKKKSARPETILNTNEFGRLSVMDVTFTAEHPQQTQAGRDWPKP